MTFKEMYFGTRKFADVKSKSGLQDVLKCSEAFKKGLKSGTENIDTRRVLILFQSISKLSGIIYLTCCRV